MAAKTAAKGIFCEIYIVRNDEKEITQQMLERLVTYFQHVMKNAGCTAHGEWVLANDDPRMVPPTGDQP